MTRRVLVATFVAGAVLLWFMVQDELTLERVVESERQLREWIEGEPQQAFAAGFVVYFVVSLFPGTTGKSAVAGWFFGFWQALVMVIGALTLASIIGFSIARFLLRDSVRDMSGPRLEWFDRAVAREGVFYLLTLRLLHVPFTFVNYLSGVSAIQPQTFVWTTAVGLIPGTVVLVGLGAGLPSLDELLARGVISLIRPAVVVALLAMGLLPWAVRGVVRWNRRHALPSDDTHGDTAPPRST